MSGQGKKPARRHSGNHHVFVMGKMPKIKGLSVLVSENG
jgi:hypothetical protein